MTNLCSTFLVRFTSVVILKLLTQINWRKNLLALKVLVWKNTEKVAGEKTVVLPKFSDFMQAYRTLNLIISYRFYITKTRHNWRQVLHILISKSIPAKEVSWSNFSNRFVRFLFFFFLFCIVIKHILFFLLLIKCCHFATVREINNKFFLRTVLPVCFVASLTRDELLPILKWDVGKNVLFLQKPEQLSFASRSLRLNSSKSKDCQFLNFYIPI